MDIKFIALDIDGTILTSDKKLTKNVKDKIIAAQERGVLVTIISGRDPQSMLAYAHDLQIDKYCGYIIGFNGAVVYNLNTKETLAKIGLDKSDSDYAFSILQKHNLSFWAYGLNESEAYIGKDEPWLDLVKRIDNKRVIKKIDYNNLPLIYKMIISLTEIENFKLIEQEITKNKNLQIISTGSIYLEIMPVNVNKGEGLKFLIKHFNISLDHCLAIGDAMNDYEMLSIVKYGIAMGNCDVRLKAVCMDITSDSDNDGVAKAIEKYVLNKMDEVTTNE